MLAIEIISWELRRNLAAVPIRWSYTWQRAKRLFAKMLPLPSATRQN